MLELRLHAHVRACLLPSERLRVEVREDRVGGRLGVVEAGSDQALAHAHAGSIVPCRVDVGPGSLAGIDRAGMFVLAKSNHREAEPHHHREPDPELARAHTSFAAFERVEQRLHRWPARCGLARETSLEDLAQPDRYVALLGRRLHATVEHGRDDLDHRGAAKRPLAVEQLPHRHAVRELIDRARDAAVRETARAPCRPAFR